MHFDWSATSYSHVEEKWRVCSKTEICMLYILVFPLLDKYQRERCAHKYKWSAQGWMPNTVSLKKKYKHLNCSSVSYNSLQECYIEWLPCCFSLKMFCRKLPVLLPTSYPPPPPAHDFITCFSFWEMTSMAMTPHLSEMTFLPSSSFVLPLLTTTRSGRLAAFLHAVYRKHFSGFALKIWISTRESQGVYFIRDPMHVLQFCQRIVYWRLYFSSMWVWKYTNVLFALYQFFVFLYS